MRGEEANRWTLVFLDWAVGLMVVPVTKPEDTRRTG